MVATVAVQKALEVANPYFDGVKTMMLTGTTAQRELRRRKYAEPPDVGEVRLIRAPGMTGTFGPGEPNQAPSDALARRAPAGAEVTVMANARQSAERGHGEVERTVEALAGITGQIGRIRELNTQMACAAGEQTVVTQDTGRNVVAISELAERTTEDATRTTAARGEPVQLAGQLERSVHRFHI